MTVVKKCKIHGDLSIDKCSKVTDKRYVKKSVDRYICKLCRNESIKKYRQKNPIKFQERDKKRASSPHRKKWQRERNLKNKNCTIDIFEKLKDAQKNKCAICSREETALNNAGKIRELSVDHCHKTEKVRGLLCNLCNPMIGYVREDISILENAIKYISTHS